jgi:hypothetical protein
MPLRANNTQNYHRCLYAGRMEPLKILKREDDLRESVITARIVYACWRSRYTRTKEPISHDVTAEHTTDWHIALSELQRVGINFLSSLDKLVQIEPQNLQELGWEWQPESDTNIDASVFGNTLKIRCKRQGPTAH